MLFNKKILNFFVIILLFSIIPASLYINFFIFKLTIWSYETKALLIYSSLIIVAEFLVLLLARKLLYFFITKYNIFNNEKTMSFLNSTSVAFLLGNIFLSLAIYRTIMWFTLPLFQGLIIFLVGVIFLKKQFINNNNLPFLKQFFTIKKSKNKSKTSLNKVYLLLFTTVLLYLLVSIFAQYIIKSNYDPLKKSMIYYMDGSKFKPVFK